MIIRTEEKEKKKEEESWFVLSDVPMCWNTNCIKFYEMKIDNTLFLMFLMVIIMVWVIFIQLNFALGFQ